MEEQIVTTPRKDPERNMRQIAFIVVLAVLVIGLIIVAFSYT